MAKIRIPNREHPVWKFRAFKDDTRRELKALSNKNLDSLYAQVFPDFKEDPAKPLRRKQKVVELLEYRVNAVLAQIEAHQQAAKADKAKEQGEQPKAERSFTNEHPLPTEEDE